MTNVKEYLLAASVAILALATAWMSMAVGLVGDTPTSRTVILAAVYFATGYLSRDIMMSMVLCILSTIAASILVMWITTLPITLGYLAASDPVVLTARWLGWIGGQILYEMGTLPAGSISGALIGALHA